MTVKTKGFTFSQRDFDKLGAIAHLEGERHRQYAAHRAAEAAMKVAERAMQDDIDAIEETLSQKSQAWYEEHDAQDLFIVERN